MLASANQFGLSNKDNNNLGHFRSIPVYWILHTLYKITVADLESSLVNFLKAKIKLLNLLTQIVVNRYLYGQGQELQSKNVENRQQRLFYYLPKQRADRFPLAIIGAK